MSLPLKLVVAAALALLALLLGAFVAAGLDKGLAEGFSAVTAEGWGVVTLLDLYAGLLVIAAWIFALERSPRVALVWALALLLLGNVVTLVYLLRRARHARGFREPFLP